jgi:two-component system cell cycle sensor histidine kinase/response regulator CckA
MNDEQQKKILIVEDENIVAKDIQNTLKSLGYLVAGIAASGEDAIQKAGATRPDLVLMDIMLRGYQDGVEAAQRIQAQHNIPVVYLTAYTDDKTLQRAKITEPYGYILKPFEERELHIAIEMAIHKHRMAKKLQEREQLLAKILKTINDAVTVLDPKGEVVFMNAAAENLTGWKQKEAAGKAVAEIFKIVDGDGQTAATNGPLTAAGSERQSWLLAKDGRQIPIEDEAVPLRDEAGNITGAVLVCRDISARRQAQANQERFRQMAEEQLRKSQRLEAIGRLAGGLAHDFNNMLTAIIGTSELAMLELHRDHPVRRDLKEIKQTADRAANLTRQLLAFARQQIIAPGILNVNDLLMNLDKMLRRLIGEDIELVMAPASDIGLVKVDAGQIEQVIVNLAVNARDAMPQGGKLILQTENTTIDQKPSSLPAELPPGDYVLLTVRDNGLGMTEEAQSHLFEPFFTTKEVGKGIGLGLATCYGIIKQNGGHIEVKSAVGEGTTFRIYLPRTDEMADTMPEQQGAGTLPQGGRPSGNETVLLVEDEPTVREVATRMLREQGYNVLVAANGDEALNLVRSRPSEPVHLLVTDVVMPRMSGRVVADQLRATHPEMKVLFISGYSDDTLTRHGASPDTNLNFLQKPFSPSLLAYKIREVLDKIGG